MVGLIVALLFGVPWWTLVGAPGWPVAVVVGGHRRGRTGRRRAAGADGASATAAASATPPPAWATRCSA